MTTTSETAVRSTDRTERTAPPATVSRRAFLMSATLAAAASAVLHGRLPAVHAWMDAAEAAPPDLVHDTFNGLMAFVVPGNDPYSVAQGVSTLEPGAVDAGIAETLLATLDASTPFVPHFSATVAGILNGIAQAVNPAGAGVFVSPFARLSFVEKVAVIQVMDQTESLKVLAGVLPAFVAFFCYSEAGVFDPATRTLTGEPVGWQLSGYQGVADGRDEFLGYFGRPRTRG